MFLIVTRNFPPDIGGMQVLMGGLSESLINHGPVKVFTYDSPNSNVYDSKTSINVERVKGIKLFKKYRKANLINSFINMNPNIRALIADHWKSLELIKTENFKKIKTFCLLHSKEINHKVGSSLNKRLIKSTNKADFIIANSNFTKELAIKVGIDSKKIYVIFPGIYKAKKIENVSKVRELIGGSEKLKDSYNDCLEQIRIFRSLHLKYADIYINKQSQKNKPFSGGTTVRGTGGTPFMSYLKKHRDETKKQKKL